MLTLREGIELILAAAIPVAIIAIIWNRTKSNKGLSVRAIQFLAVALFLPAVCILALEKVLEGSVVGTLFGGMLGYLLANFSNYDRDISEGRPSKAKGGSAATSEAKSE